MLACPFVPPARVVPPHEKPVMVSVVVRLLPAVPPVAAVTVTTLVAEAAVTSVVALLLIAVFRLVAAVVVLELSAKLVPEVDATEIEAAGVKVWPLLSDQVIAAALVLVTTTALVLLPVPLLTTAVAPGLPPDTKHCPAPHVLVIAATRLVASVAVVALRTMQFSTVAVQSPAPVAFLQV